MLRDMRPRSLLEIAGIVPHPPSLADSVLILIDHQMEYRVGNLPLEGIEKAILETETSSMLIRAAPGGRMPSGAGSPNQEVVARSPPWLFMAW